MSDSTGQVCFMAPRAHVYAPILENCMYTSRRCPTAGSGAALTIGQVSSASQVSRTAKARRMPRCRQPSHAGSWYEKNREKLSQQIDGWLAKAHIAADGPARAIIAPHAGYSYCGHVMAHAYGHIQPDSVSRVFLLGPSHHVYTRKCVLSSAQEYTTPLGPLPIDKEVYSQLLATGQFEQMNLDVDEAEHSLELHTPYIAKIMGQRQFTLVPIMVGAISTDSEARYGQLLAPYLSDPSNLFIISSDFCHWGSRFKYTFTNSEQGLIWQSIKWLDELGMKIIQQRDPAAFTEYLHQYRNTICGRHPISVLLQMVKHCPQQFSIEFKCYDQSSKAVSSSDSSVSYAAAVMTAVGDA